MWYRVFKYWVLGCWGCTWFDFYFIESIDFGVGLYSCEGERMNDGRIFFSESGGCSEEVAESVLQSAFGLSMRAIWQHMTVEISDCHVDYPYKVKLFFSLMSWLMLGGHLSWQVRVVFSMAPFKISCTFCGRLGLTLQEKTILMVLGFGFLQMRQQAWFGLDKMEASFGRSLRHCQGKELYE